VGKQTDCEQQGYVLQEQCRESVGEWLGRWWRQPGSSSEPAL